MKQRLDFADFDADSFEERVIHIDRVKKTVKGGQLISFRALVAIGNKAGIIGFGIGKARGTPDAIRKAVDRAKKNLIRVPLIGRTIPHTVVGRYGAGRVLLKPASEGTGLIAGPAVRAICQLAGIGDVLSKSLGSDNILNIAKATMAGLGEIKQPENVARLRGKTLDELSG